MIEYEMIISGIETARSVSEACEQDSRRFDRALPEEAEARGE